MKVANTDQQAVALIEAVKTSTSTVDNHKPGKTEKASATLKHESDTVELSDRAVKLSRVADTDTSSREEPATDQDQEQVTAEAESISVLA